MLCRLVNTNVSKGRGVHLSSESTSPRSSGQLDTEGGPITLPSTSANYEYLPVKYIPKLLLSASIHIGY
jgi:hypothetical protein